ncbi:16S rRNA (guanine(527)-N(7))-methyltransferase RsmG [bacterium]|nr:16S rRNA (guanine(527)-N(7))-methyltransferase RsmG [bacterium]
MQTLLRKGLKDIGIETSLDEEKEELFYIYLRELKRWNKKFNLTSYKEEDDIVIYHFLDSLLPLPHFPIRKGTLIDIGTGAGFPGVPLKIIEPCFSLYLLESNKKKIFFLKNLQKKLRLDFQILEGRAEDIARLPQFRENLDMAVARAVAPLPVLLEYSLPFLKIGGRLVSYKGPKAQEELASSGKALEILGGKIEKIIHCTLPIVGEKRVIIFILKERETPEKYPRRAGIPAKRPLK